MTPSFDLTAPPNTPAIVLRHGAACTGRMWLPQMDALADNSRVIALNWPDSAAATRMLTYGRESATYITTNASSTVTDGERYRNGERIGTAFTESTINQVVGKRMTKKQQMRWTPEGSHLLRQARTQRLNDEWDDALRTWNPDFRLVQTPVPASHVAA